jgi:hypothetical protein
MGTTSFKFQGFCMPQQSPRLLDREDMVLAKNIAALRQATFGHLGHDRAHHPINKYWMITNWTAKNL